MYITYSTKLARDDIQADKILANLINTSVEDQENDAKEPKGLDKETLKLNNIGGYIEPKCQEGYIISLY